MVMLSRLESTEATMYPKRNRGISSAVNNAYTL